MVNGYVNNYSQIQPQQFQAQQASAPQVASTQPAVTSPINPSAVSINIISPSVYGAQNQAPIPYAPIYSYPQAQTPPPPPVSATATATINQAPAPAAPPATPAAAQEPPKDSKKKQDIVPLTDTYIQTVENYLNSPNKETRTMGIKQVMNRFKDDDSRKRDAALTALLNKGLKDQDNNVRFLAMTTIAAGYAAGDDKTVELLTNLQNEKSNYNEDARLAAQALAKMSEQAQQVPNPEN